MKRRVTFCAVFIFVFVWLVNLPNHAQENSDFENFRKEMMGNYEQFRKKVFDDYADYLSGVWKEYKAFKAEKNKFGKKPNTIPKVDVNTLPTLKPYRATALKPKTDPLSIIKPSAFRKVWAPLVDAPVNEVPLDPTLTTKVPVSPSNDPGSFTQPSAIPNVSAPLADAPVNDMPLDPTLTTKVPVSPSSNPDSFTQPSAIPNVSAPLADAPVNQMPMDPWAEKPVSTVPSATSSDPALASAPTTVPMPTLVPLPAWRKCNFDFFGLDIELPRVDKVKLSSLDRNVISQQWKLLHDKVKDLKPRFSNIVVQMGLADWFVFELALAYAKAVMPDGTPSERMLLTHFILVSLEYDARLAEADGELIVLLPFQQQLYARDYFNFDGVKYYVCFEDLSKTSAASGSAQTCVLPDDVEKGRAMSIVVPSAMNINSGKKHSYKLTDYKITINGEVDEALIQMLNSCPNADVPYYAMSCADNPLRQDILRQVKPQIAGLNEYDAVARLLHFGQYGFYYATDGEQFGREKPFYIEENLFYPKNDCEDRAIFFAFLVHNLLGLDVHLIYYPGHECTAVNFKTSNPDGTYYEYEGKRFVICDPTYIGADIGQCMPAYRNVNPQPEIWY